MWIASRAWLSQGQKASRYLRLVVTGAALTILLFGDVSSCAMHAAVRESVGVWRRMISALTTDFTHTFLELASAFQLFGALVFISQLWISV